MDKQGLMLKISKEGHSFPHGTTCKTCEEEVDSCSSEDSSKTCPQDVSDGENTVFAKVSKKGESEDSPKNKTTNLVDISNKLVDKKGEK